MSDKKWFLTICLVGIFAFGAADTAIAADNTSIFWGKTKTMGNNLDGSTVKLTMGLLCRPATETPSQTSPWYPTESDLRVSAVNFQFINRPTEKIAVYESKSSFYIQSIYYGWNTSAGRILVTVPGTKAVKYVSPIYGLHSGRISYTEDTTPPIGSAQVTPFTQSVVQWELPDRLIVIQSSIVVNVGYLQMYNEQTMRDAGAIGIVKSNGEVKGIFDGSYINPAELIPVSPLVLYYKVEFPSPSYVIQAIEPHAVMNFDSFFNTNSVKVKFYIQNGKKPASSAGMTLTNTDNPVRYINETEFELDKVNIRWGRFDLGKLFYRNFYTPLRIVFDPETQFLVGQFIYDNDTTKTSEFFLAEDHCVGGRENVLAPYEYKNVGNGTNLLALFLQTLANKFRTVVQK